MPSAAKAPGGARPSYTHGYYGRDNAFYTAWEDISRERGRFLAWMEEHILAAERRQGSTGDPAHG